MLPSVFLLIMNRSCDCGTVAQRAISMAFSSIACGERQVSTRLAPGVPARRHVGFPFASGVLYASRDVWPMVALRKQGHDR